MRLIDADALPKPDEIFIEKINYRHRCYDDSVIFNAKTIEAIPVEWIEKWASRNKHISPFIMLADWRKECKRL